MNEGTKNTIVGVCLAALLGGVGTILAQSGEFGRHFVKIDAVLENQQKSDAERLAILKDLQIKSSGIPPIVDAKLDELRNRLNLHEDRINNLTRK